MQVSCLVDGKDGGDDARGWRRDVGERKGGCRSSEEERIGRQSPRGHSGTHDAVWRERAASQMLAKAWLKFLAAGHPAAVPAAPSS